MGMERFTEVSPSRKARIAGVLYFLSTLTAVLGETVFRGSLNYAAGYIAIAGMAVVTLLLYSIISPVNKALALLAASSNFAALALDIFRWHPLDVNVSMGLHGVYCLLAGYLIFRSTFLHRILGMLLMVAGLEWLTYFSPSLAHSLSPYIEISGIVIEASVFLWLLITGVNVPRWKAQAAAHSS